MVQLKYKGLSTLYVGGYAIKAGLTEMKDEDFYKLMQTKTFRFRVEQKILEVPPGFPLEKPSVFKEPVAPSESSASKPDESEDDDQADRQSVKATLKLIEKSNDPAYLQGLIDKDSRPKIVEEAKKKLQTLKK